MTTNQNGAVENITAYLGDDMAVYDVRGHRLGTVVEYSRAAGYLVVGKNVLLPMDLYIPFGLISKLDRQAVYVSLSRDELMRDYATVPAAVVTIERSVDQEGHTVSVASVLTVPNADNGHPIVVARVDVDAVMLHLAPGIAVYDARGSRVGTIKRLDGAGAYLVVETQHITRSDYYIPFCFIASFDPAGGGVNLALSRELITRDWASPPESALATNEVARTPTWKPNKRTTVEHVVLDQIAGSLGPGMRLYDRDGVPAGVIERYDAGSGYLWVLKGDLFTQDLYIPLACVAGVDIPRGEVYLAVSRYAMSRLFVVAPGSGPFDGITAS
jgi:hypothetical protein